MSFSTKYKGGELSCIMRILTIFGVVRQRQMRMLFHHMTDAEYGKVLSKLHDEGHVYCPRYGDYLASSRLVMNRMSYEDSVNCFWVFIQIRDSIMDFCAGDSPTLVTIAARNKVIDLIPVNENSIPAVNDQAECVPEDTMRFLIMNDFSMKDRLLFRPEGDFAVVVDKGGNIETYEM